MVTIIVAAEGGLKLPKVTSLEELRTALNRLGSIGAEQVGCSVLNVKLRARILQPFWDWLLTPNLLICLCVPPDLGCGSFVDAPGRT